MSHTLSNDQFLQESQSDFTEDTHKDKQEILISGSESLHSSGRDWFIYPR